MARKRPEVLEQQIKELEMLAKRQNETEKQLLMFLGEIKGLATYLIHKYCPDKSIRIPKEQLDNFITGKEYQLHVEDLPLERLYSIMPTPRVAGLGGGIPPTIEV